MIRSENSDRQAHLSSTLHISAMICCRSASVFSGVHAGIESDVAGGSRKGERRMNAPNIQNRGNTTDNDEYCEVEDRIELTKPEFEEIHCKCYWLGIWRIFRQIGFLKVLPRCLHYGDCRGYESRTMCIRRSHPWVNGKRDLSWSPIKLSCTSWSFGMSLCHLLVLVVKQALFIKQ